MNNWALTVSNPLSLDRTGECRWIAHLRWQKQKMKENKERVIFVWYERVKTYCGVLNVYKHPGSRTFRKNMRSDKVTKKAWVNDLDRYDEVFMIQIQIHPVLPLHSLIKLWRMRTIRTCHVCHFLSRCFNSLQHQWPHLDRISWPNPTCAGLWSSASSISATSSEGVTLD